MGRACFALTFPKCTLLSFTSLCAKNTSPLDKWIRSLSESRTASPIPALRKILEFLTRQSFEKQQSITSKEQEPKKQALEIEKVNTSTQSCNYMQRSIACEKSGKSWALPILLLHGFLESFSKKITQHKHRLKKNRHFILYSNHQIGYLLFIPNGGNQ